MGVYLCTTAIVSRAVYESTYLRDGWTKLIEININMLRKNIQIVGNHNFAYSLKYKVCKLHSKL